MRLKQAEAEAELQRKSSSDRNRSRSRSPCGPKTEITVHSVSVVVISTVLMKFATIDKCTFRRKGAEKADVTVTVSADADAIRKALVSGVF